MATQQLACYSLLLVALRASAAVAGSGCPASGGICKLEEVDEEQGNGLMLLAMASAKRAKTNGTLKPLGVEANSTVAPAMSDAQLEMLRVQGWQLDVLRQHNVYRCMHGVPLLTWSDSLAKQAQAWADKKQGKMVHGGNEGAGQNLAGLLPQYGYDDAYGVKMWYDEIKNTNNGRVSSFGMGTGHYTQVVWRSTTQVGCGHYLRSNCDNGPNNCLLVCNYKAPGNYAGQFYSEVNGPVKSQSACEAELNRSPSPSPPPRPTPSPSPKPRPSPAPQCQKLIAGSSCYWTACSWWYGSHTTCVNRECVCDESYCAQGKACIWENSPLRS